LKEALVAWVRNDAGVWERTGIGEEPAVKRRVGYRERAGLRRGEHSNEGGDGKRKGENSESRLHSFLLAVASTSVEPPKAI
jgi:hypothetical protein